MILIALLLFSLASSSRGYNYNNYNYTSIYHHSLSWQTLNETSCLNIGKILSGLIETKNTSLIDPIGYKCPNNTIVLEPGVFVMTTNTSVTMISPNGSCLLDGVVDTGRVISIGPLSDMNNPNLTCPVVLSPGTMVNILPSNISTTKYEEILEIKDNPLITEYSYTMVRLNVTMCIESAIIVNGLLDSASYNGTNTTYGACPVSSALVKSGVIADQTMLPEHFCLINAFVVAGRVIATGPLVSLGMNLSSGAICSLNDSIPTGVVLNAGIIMLIPIKPPSYGVEKYSNHQRNRFSYYYDEPYRENKFSKLVMDYLKAASDIERSRRIKQQQQQYSPPYQAARNQPYPNRQYPDRYAPNRYNPNNRPYPNRQQQQNRAAPLFPPNYNSRDKNQFNSRDNYMMPRYVQSNLPSYSDDYLDSDYGQKKYAKTKMDRPQKKMQMFINQGIGSLHIGNIDADINIDVDFD